MSEHPSISATVKSIEDLPTMSAVAQRLLELLGDPNYDAGEVCRTIESDQALALRILRLVNSPAYGIMRDIQTVERAVVILGAEALKNLVLCAGVAGAMSTIGSAERMQGFWRHAAYVATASRVLASSTGLADPQDAFLAGLIHDIGELALDVVRPAQWERIVDLGSRHRLQNEKKYLGMTHQRAGHLLLSSWSMPDALAQVARNHHSSRDLLRRDQPIMAMVALADSMSRLSGAGVDPPTDSRDLLRMMRALEIEPTHVVEILHQTSLRMGDMVAFLGLPPSLLPHQPGAYAEAEAKVVLLSTSKRWLAWLQPVCQHHGFQVLDLRAFLEDPTRPDLVLLDPGSLDLVQLQKLRPFLLRCRGALACCGDGRDDLVKEVLGQELPHLDYVFTPPELEAVLALVPA